jgi:hypothetical protein
MPKVKVAFFLEERQVEGLKTLSSVTRVKMSDYIREGIDIVLEKYKKDIKKAKKSK